jgi:type I restriction enzyme, S subunit
MSIPENWVYETLEKHIVVKHGFAFKSDYFSSEGSYVLLTPGNFNEKGGIRLIAEKLKYYTGSIPEDYILSENDLLVVMTEQAPGLLGSVALIPESDKYLHNQRLGLININHTKIIDKLFLYFIFNSLLIRRPIADTSSGTKVKHTSPSKIYEIIIPIPPLREQCKIAEILGVWDESIDLLEKLITAKHKLKQGLMQQLLTGKKRFEEFNNSQWKKYRFNEIFKRITRKNTIDSSNILTISGNHGLINQREIFNKRIAADNLDGYYLIKKGEFAYNKSYSNGYPLGAIKRLERYEEGVLSTLYICFETFNSSVNGDFMAHYFESGIFNKEIYGIAQEGARNHGLLNISVTDFFELLLHLPSLLEQEKIAAVLSAADTEISTLEKQLAAYKQQKCGLMQQLLTGRTRILGLEDEEDKEQK